MEGKEKLNILVLSWRGPNHPHAGGAEKSTHEHAKGWVMAGHEVTLFTSAYPGARKEEVIDGVNIIRHGSQIFGVHFEAFKWYLFSSHKKYDLIIDQFHGIPFFTPLYVNGKKLAFIHEVSKEVWSLNPWPRPLNLIPAIIGTIFEPLLFQLLYKNVPFMTVSSSTKNDLINWGIPKKNITVIHNGLNQHPLKKIPIKDKKKTLIFLGALAKDKGIEEVLKIFSLVNTKRSEFQFWVVGKGEAKYTKYLELRSYALGLERQIKFWGFVSEERKYQLLAKSYLLINPSIREGWGFVVMEAASVGTPTVGYNSPGLRDSIVDGKSGLLCIPNPTECVELILLLVENEEKYQELRLNCFKWSKEFKWKKSIEKSLRLINKVI